MINGPNQHFQSAMFEAWQLKISTRLSERKRRFEIASFLTCATHSNYLSLPICGKEMKCCCEPCFVVAFGMASSQGRLEAIRFSARFVAG